MNSKPAWVTQQDQKIKIKQKQGKTKMTGKEREEGVSCLLGPEVMSPLHRSVLGPGCHHDIPARLF